MGQKRPRVTTGKPAVSHSRGLHHDPSAAAADADATMKRHNSDHVSSMQLRLDSNQEDPSEIGDLSASSHVSVTHDQDLLDHPDNDDDDDSRSQSSSHSSSSTSTPSQAVHQIAREETQKVTRWKTFVMTLLLVNGALITIATFEFMRRQEEEEFQTAVSFL